MANFNQSPLGQTSVSGTMANYSVTPSTPATDYTTGPQPLPIRYLDPPDGQLYPQRIPIS
jgi:hypothetical protein